MSNRCLPNNISECMSGPWENAFDSAVAPAVAAVAVPAAASPAASVSAAVAVAAAAAAAAAAAVPAVSSAVAVAACAAAPAAAAAAAAAPAAAAAVNVSPGAGADIRASVVNAHASFAAGQPGTTALQPIDAKFVVFHLNINNLDVRLDLLDTLLSLHNFPEFVAITETHLAQSVEALRLSNYELVSRRDRPARQGG